MFLSHDPRLSLRPPRLFDERKHRPDFRFSGAPRRVRDSPSAPPVISPYVAAVSLVSPPYGAASAAILSHTAEVQLGNQELVAMLAAAVGAVKHISGVETLQSREAKLLADLEEVAVAGGVRGLGFGHVSADEGAEKSDGTTAHAGGSSPSSPKGPSSMTGSANAADFTGVLSPAPFTTPEVAAATRRAVDLCRAIHEAAAARALRLDAEGAHSPMSEALKVLRAAGETLEKAKTDVAALSEDSRTQLIEAERFRDTKSAELKAAEDAVEVEHAGLERRREELEEELAAVRAKAAEASSRLTLAREERREFEASNETVRATLEVKVRDLSLRAAEYDAEAAAVGACGRVLASVSDLRSAAVTEAHAAAALAEAAARRRYTAAVLSHAEGQASAMRLCLRRLNFCAAELGETRSKQARAAELGLGGDVASDLSAAAATIERKYLEAEDGMTAVLAAGAALKREALGIVPMAVNGGTNAAAPGDEPAKLTKVFETVDELRVEFDALERPEFAAVLEPEESEVPEPEVPEPEVPEPEVPEPEVPMAELAVENAADADVDAAEVAARVEAELAAAAEELHIRDADQLAAHEPDSSAEVHDVVPADSSPEPDAPGEQEAEPHLGLTHDAENAAATTSDADATEGKEEEDEWPDVSDVDDDDVPGEWPDDEAGEDGGVSSPAAGDSGGGGTGKKKKKKGKGKK